MKDQHLEAPSAHQFRKDYISENLPLANICITQNQEIDIMKAYATMILDSMHYDYIKWNWPIREPNGDVEIMMENVQQCGNRKQDSNTIFQLKQLIK